MSFIMPNPRQSSFFRPAAIGAIAFELLTLTAFELRADAPTINTTPGDPIEAWIDPGNYDEAIGFLEMTNAVSFTNNGSFTIADLPDPALVVRTYGENGFDMSSGDGGNAGAVGALTVLNTGNFSLSTPDGNFGPLVLVTFETWGGSGGSTDDSKDDGGSGSSVLVPLVVTNTGAVAVTGGGTFASGGGLLGGTSLGGLGGNTTSNGNNQGIPTYDGGKGGAPGSGGNVTLTNSGAITAQTALDVGDAFAGLFASSAGGRPGSGQDPWTGGSAGVALLTHSGTVDISLNFSGNASSSRGLYGVLASSDGADGMFSSQDNVDGSDGGYAETAIVTLDPGAAVTLDVGSSTNPEWSAAVAAISRGGRGGNAFTSSAGGVGGAAGIAQIGAFNTGFLVQGATISATGNNVAGLLALNRGGDGGHFGTMQDDSSGGGAGGTYGINATLTGFINGNGTFGASVTTNGTDAPGVVAANIGGRGGLGIYNSFDPGGNGGDGGSGGTGAAVLLSLTGPSSGNAAVTVTTSGGNSTGVMALSEGGRGGDGGGFQGDFGTGGHGAAGGWADDVALVLDGHVQVTTHGANATAVLARSSAGRGGDADVPLSGTLFQGGQDGGDGGNSGGVLVTLSTETSLQTGGDDSPGVVVQSLSGGGGFGGSVDNGLTGGAGKGGAGGSTGNVTVGHAGSIHTGGNFSTGVLAQALSGAGGAGGNGTGFFYAGGGGSTASGIVGTVTLTNSGNVDTGSGGHAVGLHAQSVAGGGGAGGSASGGIDTVGGTGDTNPVAADGNTVSILHTGSVATGGTGASGILAQSIGGGGGSAGGADGLLVDIGGSGGAGGNGSASSITIDGGSISTGNFSAHGALAQSIGGGGGTAGSATGVSLFVDVTIGGSGGTGGSGGNATIQATDATINAGGSKAIGLATQSVGLGGGAGGAAYGGGVGIGFSAGVSVGGSGGGGGDGATSSIVAGNSTILTGQSPSLTAPLAQPTNLLPVDAFGMVARSVGGGGGDGGGASAEALSAMFPIPGLTNNVGIAADFTYAAGGAGGEAGHGGVASLSLHDGSTLQTLGQGSHGMMAQSIGGGGGQGGDSSALSATVNYGRAASEASLTSFSAQIAVALGGKGGAGGEGGTSNIYVGGTADAADSGGVTSVSTFGDFANAVMAQSVGGGGGSAGFGSTTTQQFGASNSVSLGVGLGATGGTGGNGSSASATLYATGNITTYGSGAVGMLSHSIGGGGGASQGGSFNLGAQATFPVFQTTTPPPWSTSNFTYLSVVPSIGFSVGLGVNGSAGGDGGDASVAHDGRIFTVGGDATGILVQSVGGGGGLAGSTGSDASADNPAASYAEGVREFATQALTFSPQITPSFGLRLGSNGGGGGSGGNASATLGGDSTVTTLGDWAQGAILQSVGGGGGKAGSSAGTKSGMLPQITITLSSGGNGTGGNGGTVGATLDGTAIATGNTGDGPYGIYPVGGYSAFGLVLQSIGGGGGIAADGSDVAMNGVTITNNTTVNVTGGIFVGGNTTGQGGSSGWADAVQLSGNGSINTISTVGQGAHGAILQSIGGGGGIGGAGSTAFDASELPATIEVATTMGGNTTVPTAMTVVVGGGADSAGFGGEVSLAPGTPLSIATQGANAFGFLAQSIGGGGGLGFAQNTAPGSASLGGNMSAFANEIFELVAPDFAGGNVSLTFSDGSSITTSGDGSVGIVAQSVGGGGGVSNYAVGNSSLDVTGMPSSHASVGSGGNVSVTLSPGSEVATTGAGAHGILIQSVGNGGGLMGSGSSLFAGSTGGNGSMFGVGGAVTYSQSGNVSATGENAVGVFLQSTATAAHDQTSATGSAVAATISGNVTGGSGQGAAVWIDGGNGNNSLVVSAGTLLTAASGTAVHFTGNMPSAQKLDVNNSGTIIGSITTGGGEVFNDGHIEGWGDLEGGLFINEGEFYASGTTTAGIQNLGYLAPQQAATIDGDISHVADAILAFGIQSVPVFDSLAVTGAGAFDGLFVVTLDASYNPLVGDSFTLVSGASNAFNVQDFSVLGAFSGLEWSNYASGNDYIFEITAIPEPSTAFLFVAALAAFGLIRRARTSSHRRHPVRD